MVDRECLGGIPSCPEEGGPAAFTTQPLQVLAVALETAAPPAPVSQSLGLVVDPPAGQLVIYLLTGTQYRLRDSGGGPGGDAALCFGQLVFGPGAGTPDARIVAPQSLLNGLEAMQLAADAAGNVSGAYADPAHATMTLRTFLQLSPPQTLAAATRTFAFGGSRSVHRWRCAVRAVAISLRVAGFRAARPELRDGDGASAEVYAVIAQLTAERDEAVLVLLPVCHRLAIQQT